jgi:hypothetical protein
MRVGLTAFMLRLQHRDRRRKATALTTKQCAPVLVDRTALAHDIEQSAI